MLDHPNVISLYAYTDIEPRTMVLEYVHGENIADRIYNRGLMSVESVCRLVEDIAAALDSAHARGVLHRDVRPENIQISYRGQAHLIDFGLARIDGEPQVTMRGQILRENGWVSPEFRKGGRLDARCDVYSLAASAYFALTGNEPSEEEYIPIREYRPDFPARIEAVIETALSKEPSERFHTAGQMAASLRIAVESSRARGRFRLLPRWTWISSLFYVVACASALFYFKSASADSVAAHHRLSQHPIVKTQTIAKNGSSHMSHIR